MASKYRNPPTQNIYIAQGKEIDDYYKATDFDW